MPAFANQLLNTLRQNGGTQTEVAKEDLAGLDRLADISPLYREWLLAHPDWLNWVLEKPLEDETLLAQSLLNAWIRFRNGVSADSPDYLSRLRLFRRRGSLRIAYREVNEIHSLRQSTRELSLLAEFCIRECLLLSLRRWKARHGEPWDEELDKPARFCVLGMGKLGGMELNFSSDIDLIYFYEGEGHCRIDGNPGGFSNAQFFRKVAETTSSALQEQTEHGFLFRVDLRLRPEGNGSPLVRSFAAMENYYAAAGQTWERMALIKARPVAGDISLGAELLENLHSFRYPRHPPPSLLGEIAAMKTRTEKEVVGAENLRRNVKSGYGGIREIEFIVQTMQLLHAGRYPFLQTNSTLDGLDQLVRYNLMEERDARFLGEAYWFLRAVEHRLQIRGEQQTHSLPADECQLTVMARSFGFGETGEFQKKLDDYREGVRARYGQLLKTAPVDERLADWWTWFSEKQATPRVTKSLRHWFGTSDGVEGELLDFVQGSRNALLTRAQVSRFASITKVFDRVMPTLAFPLETLRRISRFASFYGSRSQFLSTCSLDGKFFQVPALLFDRSTFIHELICQRPEILEEVLRPEILRRRKSVADTLGELRQGAPGDNSAEWLWLYVKAEQVRIAIGDLLGFTSPEQTESSLSDLADAVLAFLLQRHDPEGRLLVVALGKYGGGELTFGSDLDILFLSGGKDPEYDERAIRRITQSLQHRGALGPVYETDLRLRPHGKDGPLASSPDALRRYHGRTGQLWEKQVLTRARVVAGHDGLREEFEALLPELLYSEPPDAGGYQELWNMRLRIERERDRVDPAQRAFKTATGGLVELEFFAQFLQMAHGGEIPELREPNTRHLLRQIGRYGLVDPDDIETLLDNLAFLRMVEVLLRRDKNAPVSVIGETENEQLALARWSGHSSYSSFWTEHCRRMTRTREIVARELRERWNLSIDGT